MLQAHHSKIILVGARGIGAVHARLLVRLEAEIVAVIGPTIERAEAAARDLEKVHQLEAIKASTDLNSCRELDAGAVFICSPNETHRPFIEQAHSLGLPVFCEKPLFDLASSDVDDLRPDNSVSVPGLFLNLPNRHFVPAADRERLQIANRFRFVFHTNGPYQGIDILRDLVPHGVSILQCLWEKQPVRNLQSILKQNQCLVSFDYGSVRIDFDFAEGPHLPKELAFGPPEGLYRRRQEGHGATYRVFLENPLTDETVEIADPFFTEISRFLAWVAAGRPDGERREALQFALDNQALSAEICKLADNKH